MARYRVNCITKRGTHLDPHERIQSLGGDLPRPWYDSETNIITLIEGRHDSFYTLVNYHEAEVVVATHKGRKYLKTEPDGYAPNNLLNLPECR